MAMMENSRPCSGSEHHCSHYWDLLAYRGERPHGSHGIQVGYAAQWTICFYRLLTSLHCIKTPKSPALTQDEEAHVRQFYSGSSQEIFTVFSNKERWYREHNGTFLTKDIQQVVAHLQPELTILTAAETSIQQMEFSKCPDFLDLDVHMLRQTFLHAWSFARVTQFLTSSHHKAC